MNKMVILLLLGVILVVVAIIIILLFGERLKSKKVLVVEKSLPHYNTYGLSAKEKMTYYLVGSIAVFLLGQVFYRSVILSCIAIGVYMFVITKWPQIITNELMEKRKDKLRIQFKDALQAIVSELSAGKSFGNILRDGSIVQNLKILHSENAPIVKEFEHMTREIRNNVDEESLLRDFADRSGINDIANFVDVFTICRKQGGNINQVARNTANVIIEKMNIYEEIITTISQKKQEQKVMTILPLGMVMVMSVMAPDYMSPMYTSFLGRIVMTLAILVITGAYFISKKMMNIEV